MLRTSSNSEKILQRLLSLGRIDKNLGSKPSLKVQILNGHMESAGKTTLLDVLAGRRSGSNVCGEVSMNGAPCGVMFRRISAYVPQDDVFVATLTAMETLKFRAALTVPSTVLKTQRRQRIQAVLETMGLWRVRDTKVGPCPLLLHHRQLLTGCPIAWIASGQTSAECRQRSACADSQDK